MDDRHGADRPVFDPLAFLTFRQMITPAVIVVIYVIGVIAITVFSVLELRRNAGGAILLFLGGQLYLRVVLEFIVVMFRIHASVERIDRRGEGR